MPRSATFVRLLLAAAIGAAVVACTGAPGATPTGTPGTDPTGSPTATPSASPTASPTGSPAQSPTGGVVVTFDVEGEQFKILITRAELIAHAQALLAGGTEGAIPNGLIVRGEPGVNAPWTWHIDPDSLEFADMTMEICDGLPSHVEDGTLEGERYCPWGATVVDIQPAP